jgi:hypothetical protein
MNKRFDGGSKAQLGWRGANSDEQLYSPLFKFGYFEQMHLIKHGEMTKKWEKFKEDLFEKQDGFVQRKELKTSAKSIKQQWDGRIEQFKTEFGWEDEK